MARLAFDLENNDTACGRKLKAAIPPYHSHGPSQLFRILERWAVQQRGQVPPDSWGQDQSIQLWLEMRSKARRGLSIVCCAGSPWCWELDWHVPFAPHKPIHQGRWTQAMSGEKYEGYSSYSKLAKHIKLVKCKMLHMLMSIYTYYMCVYIHTYTCMWVSMVPINYYSSTSYWI